MQKDITSELSKRFNKVFKKVLRIEVVRTNTFTFVYDLKDKFIKRDIYKSGQAIIYPTEEAREMVEKICKDFPIIKVSWNNTGSIFQVII